MLEFESGGLDHGPKCQRPSVLAIVRRTYQATDVKSATRLLTHRAKRRESAQSHSPHDTEPEAVAGIVRSPVQVAPVTD